MSTHYSENYLLNPTHPVTIHLIGAGGTGSQVLRELVRMNECLLTLGHPGFAVTVFDGDWVSEANLGRQLFFTPDIGHNKATVLVSRINRTFGLSWKAVAYNYNKGLFAKENQNRLANIIISCVDTAKARVSIGKLLQIDKNGYIAPYQQPYYWMDFGNSRKTGQVVLGTLQDITQPSGVENPCRHLPTVLELFPDILLHDNEAEQGPSCSLLEALTKQDLFINSTLTQFGVNLLWKLLRDVKITTQGVFVNLEREIVNPIPIQG